MFNGATFLFHFNGPNQSVSLVGCSVGGKESKSVYCLKKLLSSAQQLLSLQQLINFGLSIMNNLTRAYQILIEKVLSKRRFSSEPPTTVGATADCKPNLMPFEAGPLDG
ncbi:hypothetical protein T10_4536 [Trichinella papuae]|uniref:Uncharacterized protein n=1 Tax=Trichinella papuae TaxID=268474 RepID=A0A0V1M625_9BILA|nr:hypothetical protein T10_4536 [Trichinella papuae]